MFPQTVLSQTLFVPAVPISNTIAFVTSHAHRTWPVYFEHGCSSSSAALCHRTWLELFVVPTWNTTALPPTPHTTHHGHAFAFQKGGEEERFNIHHVYYLKNSLAVSVYRRSKRECTNLINILHLGNQGRKLRVTRHQFQLLHISVRHSIESSSTRE